MIWMLLNCLYANHPRTDLAMKMWRPKEPSTRLGPMLARYILIAMATSLALLVACQGSELTEPPQATVDAVGTPQATAGGGSIDSPIPTAVPTPVPTLAATPTQTPSPTSTPTPPLTPTPTPSPLIAYAQQCGSALVRLDNGEFIDDLALYTWGVFVQDIDQLVEAYGGLVPPPELKEYHAANLSAWTEIRDAAEQRPQGNSFLRDYLAYLSETHGELSAEILAKSLADFWGQESYAAGRMAQEILMALPQESREILGRLDCTPPITIFDTEAVTEPDDTDRAALTALYIATDGPNWNHNTNWVTDAPIGEWGGVTTGIDGRVTYLELSGNRMNGEIPPELGALASLRLLDLRQNQLRGEIPPELGRLEYLELLDLSWNQLVGEIPVELGNLTRLEQLELGANELSGEIPPELGDLTSLLLLSLSGNELSGEIPPELGNLANLLVLHLIGNELSGEMPSELGNLANLLALRLDSNELSGEIPPELGKLSQLQILTLSSNRLTGEVPPEIGNLTSLSELDLSRTLLTGTVPPELGNLGNFHTLRLSHNFLDGCVPSALQYVPVHDLSETPRLSFCD